MRTRRRAPAGSGAVVAISCLLVGFTLAVAGDAFGRADQQKPAERKLDKAQTQETQALVKLVTDVTLGAPAPSDFPMAWQNHYLKARDRRTFVPYVVSIPQGSLANPSVAMYLRVVRKGAEPVQAPRVWVNLEEKVYYRSGDEKFGTGAGTYMQEADAIKAGYQAAPPEPGSKDTKAAQRPEAAFEDVYFTDLKTPEGKDPLRLIRALSVLPGDYTVYLVVRERPAADKKSSAQAKTSLIKESISVPDFWQPGLATSSIIVAEKVELLSAAVPESQLAENPYDFGKTRLIPAAANRKFSKKEDLSIIFLIYNTAETDKKPDVTVEYGFSQKTEGGEKFFNKTNPQIFNVDTLPPAFDTAAGHQLVAGQSVGLGSFLEGEYRLEIKVTDKIAGKSIVQSVSFTVTP